MSPKQKFSDLLTRVAQVNGLERLRFLTSHPKYAYWNVIAHNALFFILFCLLVRYMSKRVVEAVANHTCLMPCFFVPFQSGDNQVLKMMRRGYSRERFLRIIQTIREFVPDASIIADCIVGFPGETEEQFQNSLSLMEEVCSVYELDYFACC
jgi:tRNA-2-methylthio-N6-dimethylallyladenosine synthase